MLPFTSAQVRETKAKISTRHDPCTFPVKITCPKRGNSMPKTLCRSNKPLYLNIFPSWKGRQPLRFFMLENLLEARMGSAFPTNGAGPDEDVNVFLADLLTRFLGGDGDPDLIPGAGPFFQPPARSGTRKQQADYYLTNANHRLLHLGLFNRGDGLTRRRHPFGFKERDARLRELQIGKSCYEMAANLLERRSGTSSGLVAVLRKLAENFEEYVLVVATLATRRLGLGARLDDVQWARLTGSYSDRTTDQPEVPGRKTEGVDAQEMMDDFLDRILEYKKSPTAERRQGLIKAAGIAGINPQILFSDPRKI